MTKQDYFKISIVWERTASAEFPYTAIVDGRTWVLRINAFPEEPLYTLIIDGAEMLHFSDWSYLWQKPAR